MKIFIIIMIYYLISMILMGCICKDYIDETYDAPEFIINSIFIGILSFLGIIVLPVFIGTKIKIKRKKEKNIEL